MVENRGKFFIFILLSFLIFGNSTAGMGQEGGQEGGRDAKIAELERKIVILAEEIEKLKLGAVSEKKYESHQGLGPAASKVYHEDAGVSIGGYGEVIYENYQSSTKKDKGDTQRFILYSGYKFNDWIVMNTELEFEHGGINKVSDKEPEVYVEFSYLDFLLKKELNFRTGLMLMPIGIANEYHEPTVFNGVQRPELERNVIPATWRDLGVMAYGKLKRLSYNAAVVNGLRADRFSKGSWLRSGRQQGAGINASDWGSVLKLNYDLTRDLTVGGTIYRSRAGHGEGGAQDPTPKTNEKEGRVNLWELHAVYNLKDLHFKGLYTRGTLDGNRAFQSAGVGRVAGGWYTEVAYDLSLGEKSGSRMTLTPFFRYEKYDTHKGVFMGTRDPSQARTIKTLGVGFKPHSNVVLKADFQWRDTESNLPAGSGTGLDSNKIDQFNLGLGYIF